MANQHTKQLKAWRDALKGSKARFVSLDHDWMFPRTQFAKVVRATLDRGVTVEGLCMDASGLGLHYRTKTGAEGWYRLKSFGYVRRRTKTKCVQPWYGGPQKALTAYNSRAAHAEEIQPLVWLPASDEQTRKAVAA